MCWVSSVHAQDGLNKRVDELSQQITVKMTVKQKTTIAVMEFTDLQGNTTDFGRFLAEELITRLIETEKFRIIERQLLNKIITEQKLSLTGIIDPASAKQLGKILGVDAIVAGTVTNLSQSLKVNARLISTQTGEIFAGASAEIFKDESVTGLLAKGSVSAAGSQPTPQATPQAASPKKLDPQRVQDFIFELNVCKLVGEKVTCYLTVKNDLPEDRELTIQGSSFYSPSRLFDEFGNEYLSSGAFIGSQRGGEYTVSTLVSQVPTRVIVQFDKVLNAASRLTLSLLVQAERSKRVALTMRNIQLVK
jgi:TolB-like protein